MINADFYDDWIEILRGRLAELGYTIPANSTHEDISILYFNALRRRIQPAPRTVHRSAEFSCPSELQAGLEDLEAKIVGGDDLTPHLSRGLKKAGKQDDMLNDWGVYHLHLGTSIEGDGFAERTGPVLFALVTTSSLYEIQVYPHGNWSNREVVEIIHKNWPDTIERYRLKGVIDIAHNPTSEDVKLLRDAHVNTSLKMDDGAIYMSIGGGMMSDGTGSDVLMQADWHAKTVVDLERSIKSNPSEILTALKEQGHDGTSTVKLVLEADERGLWAFCEEFSIRFRLMNTNQ
ncbi:hypothetical protein [Sulfuriroseicoccus oceanibius]|uniref:Uncharacterized protein n=1 Tax=Sulfuriroseicoccus oceanibius TaxID=2707525 RepID=A0A6B3LBC0_9BACT|nr:hypothetical protein [Sulfuriroseicoccus oceanibius]QQL44423.1 hypothetical protein G3M56_011075 [Sulfuriroseicoccus oceanibius]